MLSLHTIVFDCDGVILNSNRVKTEGFREVAKQYGEDAAESLVDYHVQNGGISRYEKFEYLLSDILGRNVDKDEVISLAGDYGDCVYQHLIKCEMVADLEKLRKYTKNATWIVASGSDQVELRKLFSVRGIAHLFDGGIFGSPDAKDKIIKRELESGNIHNPALFIGDSRYDHEVAIAAGLDFVFVYGWSEFPEWKKYCDDNMIETRRTLAGVFGEFDCVKFGK